MSELTPTDSAALNALCAWVDERPYREPSDAEETAFLDGYRAAEADCERRIAEAVAQERERCAKVCEEVVTFPPGHNGQWEGYGPQRVTRNGEGCAAAIRAEPKGK